MSNIGFVSDEEKKKVCIDFEKRTITLPLTENCYNSLKYDPTYQIYDYELRIIPKNFELKNLN